MADEIKRMGDYIVQTPGSELSYTEVKDWALAIADYALQDSQTVIDDSQADKVQSGISQYLGNEVVPKMSGANRAFVNSFVKLHVKIVLTASEKRRKQRKSARGETTQTIDIKGKVRSFNDFGLSLIWSEWGDLNSRPLGPEPSALPSALHPVRQLLYYSFQSPTCQAKLSNK